MEVLLLIVASMALPSLLIDKTNCPVWSLHSIVRVKSKFQMTILKLHHLKIPFQDRLST